MEKKSYSSPVEIVKYPDLCAALSVVLDRTAFATIASANEGFVPGGTLVHFDLKDRSVKAIPATVTDVATGVLRYDVKLMSKEADGAAAIIHGFIDLEKIPTAPTADEEIALHHITFMR